MNFLNFKSYFSKQIGKQEIRKTKKELTVQKKRADIHKVLPESRKGTTFIYILLLLVGLLALVYLALFYFLEYRSAELDLVLEKLTNWSHLAFDAVQLGLKKLPFWYGSIRACLNSYILATGYLCNIPTDGVSFSGSYGWMYIQTNSCKLEFSIQSNLEFKIVSF